MWRCRFDLWFCTTIRSGDRHVHERIISGVGIRGYKHQAIKQHQGEVTLRMRHAGRAYSLRRLCNGECAAKRVAGLMTVRGNGGAFL